MKPDDLTVHIDDILQALKTNADKPVARDELEHELKKFIDYGVPLEQAKQTLIKKYGGSVLLSSSTAERTLLGNLQPNQSNVKVLCRVIAINPKEITVRGEPRRIFYGILGDESGTVSFTAWNEIPVEKGDVVEIANAYTKEWKGDVQLNMGDRVSISKTEKDKLPKEAFTPRICKIEAFKQGMGEVEVTARILELEKRETTVDEEKKTVFSGIIGDETGKAQFTSWKDFKLKQGDVVTISGGYIKTWKGIPQLTFDERATVKKLTKTTLPKEEIGATRMPLSLLVEKRGALDVEVEGTIIEVQRSSGLVKRCPECSRVIWNGECKVHGPVEGTPDLRMKLIVDDGSGCVSGLLNRELTESLLGKSLEEFATLAESSGGDKAILLDMQKQLFARRILLRGNAVGDEFGTTIIASTAQMVDIDVQKETEHLLEKLEALP
jgi:replication factor A1